MQDKELLHELVIESREHLRSIEPDLLELEQVGDGVDSELINRVFRAVHSIKGGFGFFGLKSVTDLSHCMENIMDRIRDRKLSVSPEETDALLLGIDKLRVLLDDIENSDSISIEEELSKLTPFTTGDAAEAKPKIQSENYISEDVEKRHPKITQKQLEEALRHGKHVYEITLSQDELKQIQSTPEKLKEKWEPLGEVIDSVEGSAQDPFVCSLVFATVLEPDLIGAGLEVGDEKIQYIDLSRLKKTLNKSVEKQHEKKNENRKEKTGSSSGDSKLIEDALRVKVNLLNSLMNLAGELVLSRNQLLQKLNLKFLEAADAEKMLNSFDMIVNRAFSSLMDKCDQDRETLKHSADTELQQMRESFRQILSMRLCDLPGVNTALGSIDSVTSQLQENIMQTRLQPVSVVFSKFPRVVRDLARKLEKKIDLEIIGQDVELDKSLIELLSDPLTHLIRNSVDHGVEIPSERVKKGKDEKGKIVLRAFHEGGKVLIQIEDNGAGINVEKVKQKAIEKGLINAETAQQMSVREIQEFIMHPGFSTAAKVSDVSGRGVGMDVVKSNIEKLGGSIDISSEQGQGTCLTLELPLTLAIIPSLIVTSEDRAYAIPQVAVEELVRIRSFEITDKIERVQDSEVIRLRDSLLPLVRLSDLLGIQATFIHPVTGERMVDKRQRWSDRRKNTQNTIKASSQKGENERRQGPDRRQNVRNAVRVIVLKIGENRFGLMVDSVSDSEEIVVKSLPEYLKSTQIYAGATIMGDGRVAMILDPAGIANRAGLKFNALKELSSQKDKENSENKDKCELLVFDNGTQECFGLDLSHVARIEKVKPQEIETVGSRQFLKRDTVTFPIIRLHEFLPVSSPEEDESEMYAIIPKNSQRPVGIIAKKVHDVFSSELNLDKNSIQGTGIQGTMVINNRMTVMLDLPSLIEPVLEHA
ncbi:MAG: chemotaxis protein CheW [Chitinispirillaceae bacterium]